MTNAIKLHQPTEDMLALIRRMNPGEILRVSHTHRTHAGIVGAVTAAKRSTGKNYTVRNLPTLNVTDITCY